MSIIIKLILIGMIPVIFSLLIYILQKNTAFGKIPYAAQQVIIGIVFGAVAIVGTEFGVDVGGATANARDAAPLCAGLIFGGPSAIISGIIGGVERWFAASWGAGMYSQIACSVSTILAGFFAAFVRKVMLDNKRPAWGIGVACAVVMEVIHFTILVLTHADDLPKAFAILKICVIPMILVTSLSLMLSLLFVAIYGRRSSVGESYGKNITYQMQIWLLICVVVAYCVTTFFVYYLQTKTTVADAERALRVNVNDVITDMQETSDDNLLKITRGIVYELKRDPDADLDELCGKYEVSEINVVGTDNVIKRSTNPEFIGYNMSAGAQSAEFTVLNKNLLEYVQKYMPISYDTEVSRKYAGVILPARGFVQVGYDYEMFVNQLSQHAKTATNNRHVEYNGYLLIANEDHTVVSGPSRYIGKKLEDFGAVINEDYGNIKIYPVEIEGVPYFSMYNYTEGFYVLSLMPQSEVYYTRDATTYINSFMEVIVFAILFFMIYMLIKKLVVNKIRSVNDSLAKIIKGDLNVVVNVRSSDEFSSLSDDINSTVDTLKRYIDEAAARIDKELEFAKNIQHSALPSVFPAYPNINEFDIYATMDTAKEVGGDFYDFYMLGDDKLAFLIADVSGKGIPAAMFMMTAKTMLKNFAESGFEVNDVFTHANEKLCEGNDAGMFVTAWMGMLDIKTGHVKFANAGHNPPVIYRKDTGFEYLKSRAGFVLAGMDGVKYKLQEFDLMPGDKIYLYTDGVTEATDGAKQLYGEDRLIKYLNSHADSGAEETLRGVKKDIDAFVGDAEQFDDITMLMVDYKGKMKEESSMKTKEFPATDEALADVTAFLEEELESYGASLKTVMQMSVVLEELFVNVAHYAYGDRSGNAQLSLGFEKETRKLTMILSDEGMPFDPTEIPDPDVTLSAEDRKIGGLGIFMVRKTMDTFEYKRENNKNIITLTKVI